MSKKPLKPDSYRLRKIGHNWFLRLFCGDEWIEDLGPFTYHKAQKKAEELNLRDGDRE